MPKALAFGTFDGFHAGHRFYLDEAAKRGELMVVVARDETVKKVKGRPPQRSEETRMRTLTEAGYHAVLGSLGDKYAVLRSYCPDVVCLGYDQEAFVGGLEKALHEAGLESRVLRMPAYKPETYKSSLLNR